EIWPPHAPPVFREPREGAGRALVQKVPVDIQEDVSARPLGHDVPRPDLLEHRARVKPDHGRKLASSPTLPQEVASHKNLGYRARGRSDSRHHRLGATAGLVRRRGAQGCGPPWPSAPPRSWGRCTAARLYP